LRRGRVTASGRTANTTERRRWVTVDELSHSARPAAITSDTSYGEDVDGPDRSAPELSRHVAIENLDATTTHRITHSSVQRPTWSQPDAAVNVFRLSTAAAIEALVHPYCTVLSLGHIHRGINFYQHRLYPLLSQFGNLFVLFIYNSGSRFILVHWFTRWSLDELN
jgi:hypothetical protein